MVGIAGLEIRRGQAEEAGAWCDRVIAEGDIETNPSPIARAYYVMSLVSGRLGRPTANEEAEKALEIYESLGDKIGAANALNNLGLRAFYTGAWAGAEDYHSRNLETRRSSGDVLGMALAGYNLGELYLEQGRYAEAQSLLERTLAEFRGAGHQVGEAATRLTLGRLAARLGDAVGAVAQFDRAEEIATEADAHDQLNEGLLGRVELALAQGDFALTTQLLARIDDDVTGPSLIRRHLFEAVAQFADEDPDAAAATLNQAKAEADRFGAKHLEFAIAEMRDRFSGTQTPTVQDLAEPLGLLTRPVFRIR